MRDCLRACATCSGITTAIEQGKRRDDDAAGDDADDDIVVTSNGKRHDGLGRAQIISLQTQAQARQHMTHR